MQQRYAVFPGQLKPDHLGELDPIRSSAQLDLLTESSSSTQAWARALGRGSIRQRRDLQQAITSQDPARSRAHRAALDLVLSDPRTVFIIEREWGLGFGDRSVFNHLPRLAAICWNALRLLEDRRPEAVVIRSTPHLVEPWVTALIAESLDIPVVMSAGTPVPGFAWVVEGVDAQEMLRPADPMRAGTVDCDLVDEIVDQFLRTRRADYGTGAPPAHQRALTRARRSGWNHRTEADQLRRSMQDASGLRQRAARAAYFAKRSRSRRALWAAYERLAVRPQYDIPTLTIFLHYQPERTTLPEAGRFGDQYEHVRLLSNAVPDGWQIHVREHPAMFAGPGPFHPSFRSPELYHRLAALPQVQLTTIDEDPFTAIDRSAAVATATGTVGVEALCRATPTIAAGAASFRTAPGVLSLHGREGDLEGDIETFLTEAVVPADPALADWMRAEMRTAFAPWAIHEQSTATVRLHSAHGRALAAYLRLGAAGFDRIRST